MLYNTLNFGCSAQIDLSRPEQTINPGANAQGIDLSLAPQGLYNTSSLSRLPKHYVLLEYMLIVDFYHML